jgi:hypothetical protein
MIRVRWGVDTDFIRQQYGNDTAGIRQAYGKKEFLNQIGDNAVWVNIAGLTMIVVLHFQKFIFNGCVLNDYKSKTCNDF